MDVPLKDASTCLSSFHTDHYSQHSSRSQAALEADCCWNAYARHPSRLTGNKKVGTEYVFPSQLSVRLTEEGIHHWFRNLKARATKDQWEHIADLTFHDLRHDFAHRAREAGWSLEEVAYYLGHLTKKGTPAVQTTVRYTQVSREQVKEKLRLVRG